MATFIRIVRVPAGEAPFWVREKWVGLSMPLIRGHESARTLHTAGVLSGPRGHWSRLWALVRGRLVRETGFLVEVEVAVAALAVKSPEAARWWREHTPHLFEPGRAFMFQRNSAELDEATY
jgi:hypothetical protein